MLGHGALGQLTLGDSPTYQTQAIPATDDGGSGKRRGGPPPLSYVTPPRTRIKQEERPSLSEVREVYAKAREIVPKEEQRGLLPIALRTRGKSDAVLPGPASVDFEALRANLDVLEALKNAILLAVQVREAAKRAEYERIEREAFQAKELRRRRDEEALMLILLHI